VPRLSIAYGADAPLEIAGDDVARLTGPEGRIGEAAGQLVAAALAAPTAGPPLAAHVVAGDRAVMAIAGAVPQEREVHAAVAGCLAGAGVDDPLVLAAPPLDPPLGRAGPAPVSASRFDPDLDAATSYLAADAEGRPLYVARALVDADVVIFTGDWCWDPTLGGRGLDGELWPGFGRRTCRHDLLRAVARRGRHALADWRQSLQEITWQLGVCASLRLVAGRGGSLDVAFLCLPDAAAREAVAMAATWCTRVDAAADVTIATLSDPNGDFDLVTRAVAAAARVTTPDGIVCIASRTAAAPGPVLVRARQSVPLDRLVHEAVAGDDPVLVASAVQARLFVRALGDRRLVLLTDLDETAVEEAEFTRADEPGDISRLAARADRVLVLEEADRMLPGLSDRATG